MACSEIVTSSWLGKKVCDHLCGGGRDRESARPLEGFEGSGTSDIGAVLSP